MDYVGRIQKLQRVMQERDVSWALIAPGPNFYYLTGMSPLGSLERLFFLLVPQRREPVIIAPKLYENDLSDWESGMVFLWRDDEDPYVLLKEIMGRYTSRDGRVLVDGTIPIGTFLRLGLMGRYRVDVLDDLISKLRIVKDDDEVRLLKKAAEIADKTLYEVLDRGINGKKEKEVAAWIEFLVKSLGAEGTSFEPIVASGPNSANPHHRPTDRKIRRGDVVILDYGARYRSYCSDITRTLVVGEPPENVESVYETVKEAQEKAFQAVKDGVTAEHVDDVARGHIERAGYGEYFIHRTGHGIGLDVHEEPYIAPGNSTILRNGMVFTIEPGVYLPNRFGVRIEDDVLVKDGHGVRLTKAFRDLMVVS